MRMCFKYLDDVVLARTKVAAKDGDVLEVPGAGLEDRETDDGAWERTGQYLWSW